jgi:hypothetical protein
MWRYKNPHIWGSVSVERLENTPPCGDAKPTRKLIKTMSVERLERENLWLKTTIGKKAFSHPVSCCFGPSPLDKDEANTLDMVIKVQSTL